MKNTLIILLFFLSLSSYAGNNKADKTKEAKALEWIKNQPLEFVENKGQFMRTDGKAADEVFFKTSFGGCDIYITDKGLSYVFVKFEEAGSPKSEDGREEREDPKLKFRERKEGENKKVSYYRLDMNLEGASISKNNIIKENESKQGHSNYFYAHCPEGIYDVKAYGKITIKNIYKGIDWVIYTNSDSKEHPLKYDFVVHPEADYKNIKIKFLNAQSTSLSDNDTKLKIETIAGNIEEGNLFSYIKNEKLKMNNEKLEVRSKYVIDKDSIICFEIAEYDTTKTLVIDPLVWATYYGGSIADYAQSICIDSQDNVYISGHTSSNDFPIQQLIGAYYQASYFTSFNHIFILKFNIQGVRQWATYYGGDKADEVNSLCCNSQDEIYITGHTNSNNFPTQQLIGAFWQSNNYGLYGNAFIIMFNNQGVRKWATFFGGNSEDSGTSICIDSQDNVFITGYTSSSNLQIVQLNGAYWQSTLCGGISDLFILKFNIQGIMQWGTYYGGNSNELVRSMTIDTQDNIILIGETNSFDLPIQQLTGAYWQANCSNGGDGFMLKFNNLGIRNWATYYGGNGSEQFVSICTDNQDNIFVFGYTGSTDFPIQQLTGAFWQASNAGNLDAFIIMFNNQGVRKWATYYGGSGMEHLFGAIRSDKYDNIYITGCTDSQDFPIQQLSGEYWQTTFAGGVTDAFLLKFNKYAVRKWATYFGNNGIFDFGKRIAFDSQNSVYFIGESLGNNLFTIDYGNGAFYDDSWNGSSDCYFLKSTFPCNNQRTTFLESDRSNICYNDKGNITLTAIGGEGDTLKWYLNSCGQNYIGINTPFNIPSPTQTTTYYARWESDCDTSECDSITILVEVCEIKLELPNIITPNNDGSNDLFIPLQSKNIEKMNTQIFNRWGNLVFETDNLHIEWDGKSKGQLVADGVYFWIVNYTDINGKVEMMKGSVTVMK